MKKITGYAAVLIAAGFLFAQEPASLSLSGTINGGVKAAIDGNDSTVQLYSDDYDTDNVGAALTIDGSYDAGTYGAEFEVYGEYGSAGNKNEYHFNFGYAYGWAKLFNDAATVKAGALDSSQWETTGDQEISFISGGGAILELSPVAGLSIGVAGLFSPTATDTDDFADLMVYELGYGNDLFNVWAMYSHKNADFGNAVAFNFSLSAIPNLSFVADGVFGALDSFDDEGIISLSETVEYAITEPFALGLLSYQKKYNAEYDSEKKELSSCFTIEPYAVYTINDTVSAGLGGGYTYNFNADNTWYVKPQVTFTLSDNASIVMFYEYNNAESDVAQLDFIWTF